VALVEELTLLQIRGSESCLAIVPPPPPPPLKWGPALGDACCYRLSYRGGRAAHRAPGGIVFHCSVRAWALAH
jgi:hypothetical protein